MSEYPNENRMLVTVKVSGFLPAVLAVRLALGGLSDLGMIQLVHR